MISRGFTKFLLVAGSVLPVRSVRWIARNAGALVYYVPAARRGLLDNARHILGPDSTLSERRHLARSVLENFGVAVGDLILGPRGWPDPGALPLVVEGTEHFAKMDLGTRGFIAVTLHMGSYEVGGALLASKSGSATIVYHRDPAGFFENLRSRQRQTFPIEEVAIDRSPFFAIELLERLKRGGAVMMAGELAAGARGEPFEFLDGTAPFSLWPARLAISAEVPILPAFTVREPSGEFRLYLEEPIQAAASDDPRELMKPLIAIFERYVRRYPDQWLMVRPFFQ